MRAFLHFVLCASLFCVLFRRSKGGVHHLLKKFLRLRSFNALISFSACALRGDVELFLASLFRSCGLTSTGDELLSVRSHVACVSEHSQNKKPVHLPTPRLTCQYWLLRK